MIPKVQIEDLPVTEAFLREKRLIQDRGELALIEDGKPFQHLGYFSLKKGKGYFRGGHYHLKKVEYFYVISGKLRVHLVDLDSGERSEISLREGQRVTLFPRCAHRFMAERDAQVIEYYNDMYDPDDDTLYNEF